MLQTEILLPWKRCFAENHVRFGALALRKRNFRRPKIKVLAGSYSDFCRKLVLKKWCFFIDVWNLGFDQFQGAFLSTVFLALELALFQQFMNDAGSLDGKKQDLIVAQSAKDDSATGPLQHHQLETPVDCTHDVAMYSMPASPHDRDVMHKARGVM